jgi:nucleotide-binding universal stress UspA family protein
LQGKARAEADRAGVSLSLEITEGDVVGELLRLIEGIKPDLLVIGLRHEHGTVGRLMGGTAHQMAVHAKCNVLGVH